MTYLLDTNIILFVLSLPPFEKDFQNNFRRIYNDFMISVVTEGEIRSLALQRGWGEKRNLDLENVLEKLLISPIKIQNIIDAYARIDAYSQGKLSEKPLPAGMTSRNMGKNDLWIAATAHALQVTLITTDKDFDHLDGVFLKLNRIDITPYYSK